MNTMVCQKCGVKLHGRSKNQMCMRCLSVCECGNPKDFRAVECRACASSRYARIQWATKRGTILQGIREAGVLRRTRFQDLSMDTVWQRRQDGRYWTWHWDGDVKRTVYRYQWVWITANGPIPPGHVIHHLNKDRSDDRIENLALVAKGKHALIHSPERNLARWGGHTKPTWTCETCGKTFKHSSRKRADGYHPVRFCSLACCRVAQRSTTYKSHKITLL